MQFIALEWQLPGVRTAMQEMRSIGTFRESMSFGAQQWADARNTAVTGRSASGHNR
jgi:hypothetical protein